MRRLPKVCCLIAVLLFFVSYAAAEKYSPDGDLFEIKFGPAMSPPPEDIKISDGSVYSAERGFGWDQDLTKQARDRGDGCTGVALIDRGITLATFTVDLPDGNYVFDVTAGDSQFSYGLAVMVGWELVAEPQRGPAGKTSSLAVPVTSSGGKASITFVGGREGTANSVINSITIYSDPDKYATAKSAVDSYREGVRKKREAKSAKHARQRAAYKPVAIVDHHQPRQTIDLCGAWLFAPNTEMTKIDVVDPATSDANWHVMNVPDFWKPIEWWIYMQGNGTSQNFYRDEVDRCEGLTFDYRTAEAGHYRQWIEVPRSMKGRRLVLRFDAVASVADVYWNGSKIGSHIGMFGAFECEATPHVRFGEKNLLVVRVSSGRDNPKTNQGKGQVAVTVNITAEMLNSLAHGWYKPGMAGIWQPVSLIVSGPSRIADVFFKPRLDGARIETAVSPQPLALSSKERSVSKGGLAGDRASIRPTDPAYSALAGRLIVRHTITDAATGATLYSDAKGVNVSAGKAVADISKLKPKLWSPEHPNLYTLKTRLISDGKVVDEVSTTVGFKTFEARGSKLYLNGKPYFLRGANMPPHGLRPNDKPLADKFMKMMHDGNTMATRFHIGPPSKIWLDACDKYGVGASVGENWPWILMGDTPIPDKWLIDQWRRDLVEIVRAHRNHPSMFMWTVSNESYFEGDPDLARRVEKYRIFSDTIKAIRAADPGTPVVFHSGHVRDAKELPMLKQHKLDDGDIDDEHAYFGWYNRSPFNLDVAKDLETRGTDSRPLISQEASTGYPDNDTGHPVESYITSHSVPQAWVGQHALYTARPDMFLETHGQITKEYAEKVRRDRTRLAGWMLFANCCWFKDVYDADTISPYPAYWGVRKAYQPVLVSLADPNRHFEAGQKFASDVVIVNDDPDRPKLTGLTLVWRIRTKSNTQTSGSIAMPNCAYDGKCRSTVEFQVPSVLPKERSTATLELELRCGDEVISTNDYPLICAAESFYRMCEGKRVIVLEADSQTSDYLTSLDLSCDRRTSIDWKQLKQPAVVVIGQGVDTAAMGSAADFSSFVRSGGRVLIVGARGMTSALSAIPDFAADKVKVDETLGDYADVFSSQLLSGLDPMDMHWWNAPQGGIVRVSEFAYQIPEVVEAIDTTKPVGSEPPTYPDGIAELARHIQPHGYIRKPGALQSHISCPAFELSRGSGRVIVSSFLLADDPLARRFIANLIGRLMP